MGPALLENPLAAPGHRLRRMVRRQPGAWTVFEAEALDDGAPVEVAVVAAALQFEDGYAGTFERAVARLTAFDHPAVLRVRGGGRAERGLVLVTDPAPTPGVLDLLDERPWAPFEALSLLAPVADGLDALHAAGIPHGAVSPDVLRVAAKERLQLIDPGLSTGRRRRPGGSADVDPCLAPELAGGALPTPASDVYGFAATAWRCLTGGFDRDASGLPKELLDALKLGLLVEPHLRPATVHGLVDGLLRVAFADRPPSP